MTTFLIILIVVLVALPPKWDPNIRWKEYNERRRLEIRRQYDGEAD